MEWSRERQERYKRNKTFKRKSNKEKRNGRRLEGEEGRFSAYVELRYRARGMKTRVEEGSKGRDRLVGRESWF